MKSKASKKASHLTAHLANCPIPPATMSKYSPSTSVITSTFDNTFFSETTLKI
jgi:hypothetical protein